jgi:hypothetical protein
MVALNQDNQRHAQSLLEITGGTNNPLDYFLTHLLGGSTLAPQVKNQGGAAEVEIISGNIDIPTFGLSPVPTAWQLVSQTRYASEHVHTRILHVHILAKHVHMRFLHVYMFSNHVHIKDNMCTC